LSPLATLLYSVRRRLAALRGHEPPPPPSRKRADATHAKGEQVREGEEASSGATLLCWPLDHHYSPVPDVRKFTAEPARSRIWPSAPKETPGIDWRPDAQVRLLSAELGVQEAIRFPDGPTGDPTEYHTANRFFSPLDAWVLQAMLRHFRPRRMIEVGCGWSSLVTARVNREHLGAAMEFTCIEPHPPEFLADGVKGISRIIDRPVEELPVDRFGGLGANDVLFIDTTHTVKTGGDVNYLFHEVVPTLAAGVIVHIHDVFLPWDYPEEWVLAGRAWNEQYLVQSFLAFNWEFEILLGVAWMSHSRPDVFAEVVPGFPESTPNGGGSLWIRRRGA
jgi:Methyltransferase domain